MDFSYKNFTLSFQFVGSVGNKLFDYSRYAIEGAQDGTGGNLRKRWTESNQNTDVPAIIDAVTRENAGLTSKISLPTSTDGLVSRWTEDASYLRMQYANLGYNIPERILKKAHLTSLRVQATVSNVFTITKYQGYNPEVASWSSNDQQVGSDFNSYPAARTYTLGFLLNF